MVKWDAAWFGNRIYDQNSKTFQLWYHSRQPGLYWCRIASRPCSEFIFNMCGLNVLSIDVKSKKHNKGYIISQDNKFWSLVLFILLNCAGQSFGADNGARFWWCRFWVMSCNWSLGSCFLLNTHTGALLWNTMLIAGSVFVLIGQYICT